MKKNRWIAWMAVLLAFVGVLNYTGSAAAADPGTDQDPLVSLSYLNETFLKQILDKVDQKISQRNDQIVQQLGGQVSTGTSTASTFTVVTLTKGQTLTGAVGCEVMLRVGSAVCVSSSTPGLIDETGGSALNNGSSLSQNHLYMMTIEGRGVKATADTTKLLVRGGYTIA